MHPQMQRSNGVKLLGMSGTAQRARSLLEEASLLPEGDEEWEAAGSAPESDRWASTVYNAVLLLGALALMFVLLMFTLG
jgi:hypothetical protein